MNFIIDVGTYHSRLLLVMRYLQNDEHESNRKLLTLMMEIHGVQEEPMKEDVKEPQMPVLQHQCYSLCFLMRACNSRESQVETPSAVDHELDLVEELQ